MQKLEIVGYVIYFLVTCWLKSRHSKASETVFILKFCAAVAKKYEFEIKLICLNLHKLRDLKDTQVNHINVMVYINVRTCWFMRMLIL